MGKNLKGRKFFWTLPIFKLRENYNGIREFYKLRISSKIRRFLYTSGFFLFINCYLNSSNGKQLKNAKFKRKTRGFFGGTNNYVEYQHKSQLNSSNTK
jgi:hypothetical protein